MKNDVNIFKVAVYAQTWIDHQGVKYLSFHKNYSDALQFVTDYVIATAIFKDNIHSYKPINTPKVIYLCYSLKQQIFDLANKHIQFIPKQQLVSANCFFV